MRLGDMVLTSNGYRKVLNVWKRKAANILAYRLTCGQIAVEVRATPDHNVKTSKGGLPLMTCTSVRPATCKISGNRNSLA